MDGNPKVPSAGPGATCYRIFADWSAISISEASFTVNRARPRLDATAPAIGRHLRKLRMRMHDAPGNLLSRT